MKPDSGHVGAVLDCPACWCVSRGVAPLGGHHQDGDVPRLGLAREGRSSASDGKAGGLGSDPDSCWLERGFHLCGPCGDPVERDWWLTIRVTELWGPQQQSLVQDHTDGQRHSGSWRQVRGRQELLTGVAGLPWLAEHVLRDRHLGGGSSRVDALDVPLPGLGEWFGVGHPGNQDRSGLGGGVVPVPGDLLGGPPPVLPWP